MHAASVMSSCSDRGKPLIILTRRPPGRLRLAGRDDDQARGLGGVGEPVIIGHERRKGLAE